MAKDYAGRSMTYQDCACARRIAQTMASSVTSGSSGCRHILTSRTPGACPPLLGGQALAERFAGQQLVGTGNTFDECDAVGSLGSPRVTLQ
jgi:hypothetical protein